MGWVRLEDDFYDNRKLGEAGPLAELLWIRSLAWVNRNTQDGVLPPHQVRRLADFAEDCDYLGKPQLPAMLAERLVAAGLWEEVENGYLIHNYHDFQPSAEEVMAKRVLLSQKRSLAGRKGAFSRWEKSRSEMAKWQTDGKEPYSNMANAWPPSQVLLKSSSSLTSVGPSGVEEEDSSNRVLADACAILAERALRSRKGAEPVTNVPAWLARTRQERMATHRNATWDGNPTAEELADILEPPPKPLLAPFSPAPAPPLPADGRQRIAELRSQTSP